MLGEKGSQKNCRAAIPSASRTHSGLAAVPLQFGGHPPEADWAPTLRPMLRTRLLTAGVGIPPCLVRWNSQPMAWRAIHKRSLYLGLPRTIMPLAAVSFVYLSLFASPDGGQ